MVMCGPFYNTSMLIRRLMGEFVRLYMELNAAMFTDKCFLCIGEILLIDFGLFCGGVMVRKFIFRTSYYNYLFSRAIRALSCAAVVGGPHEGHMLRALALRIVHVVALLYRDAMVLDGTARLGCHHDLSSYHLTWEGRSSFNCPNAYRKLSVK